MGTRLKFIYKNVRCLANQQPSQCDSFTNLRENMMDFRFLGGLCHCLFSGPRVQVWTWIPGPLPGPPINNENYLQPLVTPVTPKFNIFFFLWIQSFGGPLLCSREGFGVVKYCCSCSLKERKKKTTFDPRE